MKKNIVIVVSAMNMGGAQRVVSILCNHWSQSGYAVTLISTFTQKKINHFQLHKDVNLKYLSNKISSIRDSQGSCYFCDLSIQVMKPICFEEMDNGNLPFKWQGRKSRAIETDFGFDIDTQWQYLVIEHWLKEHGYTESNIPWSEN